MELTQFRKVQTVDRLISLLFVDRLISLLFLFPAHDRVSALLYAPPGMTHLLYRVVPFSSRSGMPDYLLWYESGMLGAGYFGTDWAFDAQQGVMP